MLLKELLKDIIIEHLTGSYLENESELRDAMFGNELRNFHIFQDKLQSYHAQIERGLIVKFYLNEFLKYYEVDDLNNINSWEEFIRYVHDVWGSKKLPNQEVVFRRGGESNEMFFSNDIYVAAVYKGRLNAYILNLKNPYILDCEESNWFDIEEPEIMRGESYDGKVSTDNIVEFIKELGVHDGVIFLNLFEGNGATNYSTVYVSLNPDNAVNLTNN